MYTCIKYYCTVQQGKAREKMLKYQEELERQYRAEEDRLMEVFLREREEELSRIDKEAKDEWEVNLRALLEKYEKMGIKPDALPLTGARGPRNSRGGSTGDEVDDRGRNVRWHLIMIMIIILCSLPCGLVYRCTYLAFS